MNIDSHYKNLPEKKSWENQKEIAVNRLRMKFYFFLAFSRSLGRADLVEADRHELSFFRSVRQMEKNVILCDFTQLEWIVKGNDWFSRVEFIRSWVHLVVLRCSGFGFLSKIFFDLSAMFNRCKCRSQNFHKFSTNFHQFSNFLQFARRWQHHRPSIAIVKPSIRPWLTNQTNIDHWTLKSE